MAWLCDESLQESVRGVLLEAARLWF